MTIEIQTAIEEYLKKQNRDVEHTHWESPSDIMKAIYPQFEKTYPDKRGTFKRLFFRALKKANVMKNFHGDYYAYERKPGLSENNIYLFKHLFELPYKSKGYLKNLDPDMQAHFYPNIPLEDTAAFKEAGFILSRFWKDPREDRIGSIRRK